MSSNSGGPESDPQPRHRRVQSLRLLLERLHWEHVRLYACGLGLYHPWIEDPDNPSLYKMFLHQANDCCNKSTGVYVLAEPIKESRYEANFGLVRAALNNYLYRRWLRPYRSDIEYGQFIAKTIIPDRPSLWPDTSPAAEVDVAVSLHTAVCARAEETLLTVKNFDPNDHPWNPFHAQDILSWYADVDQIIRDREFFILRPLFRALIITIRSSYEGYGSTSGDIGQFPVLLVHTGVEDGLSAPISFEHIAHKIHSLFRGVRCGRATAAQTTLETAVTFVLDMERREVAAFGPQPDPEASTAGNTGFRPGCLDHRSEHIPDLSAIFISEGDEPLLGPSSAWVDTEIHPECEWRMQSDIEIGMGQHEDEERRKGPSVRR